MRILLLVAILVVASMAFTSTHPGDVHPAGPPTYAELYQVDAGGAGGTDITVTTGGTYYGWTSATAGHNDGMLLDTTNATADRITVRHSGDYRIMLAASFSGSANAQVTCTLFVSGVADDHLTFTRKLSAAGDVGSAAATSIDRLAAGDYVDLRCTTVLDSKVINIWSMNLSLSLLH